MLTGYLILFLFYQLPQTLQLYVTPNPGVWLAATALFFLVAHLTARRLRGTGLASYSLAIERTSPRQFVTGIVVGFACAAVAGYVSWKLGLYRIDSVLPWHRILPQAALLAFGSFWASLAEDILTRGYLWWQLGRARTKPAALTFCLLSAALYVANHIYVLNRGPAMWSFLALLGFALAWALAATDSLWLTFGAHWGWNLVYH